MYSGKDALGNGLRESLRSTADSTYLSGRYGLLGPFSYPPGESWTIIAEVQGGSRLVCRWVSKI